MPAQRLIFATRRAHEPMVPSFGRGAAVRGCAGVAEIGPCPPSAARVRRTRPSTAFRRHHPGDPVIGDDPWPCRRRSPPCGSAARQPATGGSRPVAPGGRRRPKRAPVPETWGVRWYACVLEHPTSLLRKQRLGAPRGPATRSRQADRHPLHALRTACRSLVQAGPMRWMVEYPKRAPY